MNVSSSGASLTGAGASGYPAMAVQFARSYAMAEGWVFLPGDTRWPFRPWQADCPLALPEGDLRERVAQYLRRARFIATGNTSENKRAAYAALRVHFGDVLEGYEKPDLPIDSPLILVLTEGVVSDGPVAVSREYMQRLRDIIRQRQDISDIMVLDRHGPAQIWKPQALFRRLEREFQLAVEELANPPIGAASPEPPDPEPG